MKKLRHRFNCVIASMFFIGLIQPRLSLALDNPFLGYDYFRIVEQSGRDEDFDFILEWEDAVVVQVWDRIDSGGQGGYVSRGTFTEETDKIWNNSCASGFSGSYWWNYPDYNPPTGGEYYEYDCASSQSGELTAIPDVEPHIYAFEKCAVSHHFTNFLAACRT